jgi:hypothetical protein
MGRVKYCEVRKASRFAFRETGVNRRFTYSETFDADLSKFVKTDLARWDATGSKHLGAGLDHQRETAKIIFHRFGVLVLIKIIL